MRALASIATRQGVFQVRRAIAEDVAHILELLGDDPIGSLRETGADERTAAAFVAIDADPNQLLIVVVDGWEDVVATMQVTFIPNLSRNGTLRAQLEAVRVSAELRDLGLGSALLRWVLDECRRRGAGLVQLTTDKRRDGARRFYEAHGFVASHEGMKLELG
ncbi:GNAT family N-acetyltransferase [Amnibacterium sp.]|uniref:GNAT family N-acetyltransferase n=1 Tax=Amnibacterium sp. TaxID=1872496 RepID=UPI00261D702D|nr:GNAT family N-acetyltransferase [Amnibacterium sp.]